MAQPLAEQLRIIEPASGTVRHRERALVATPRGIVGLRLFVFAASGDRKWHGQAFPQKLAEGRWEGTVHFGFQKSRGEKFALIAIVTDQQPQEAIPEEQLPQGLRSDIIQVERELLDEQQKQVLLAVVRAADAAGNARRLEFPLPGAMTRETFETVVQELAKIELPTGGRLWMLQTKWIHVYKEALDLAAHLEGRQPSPPLEQMKEQHPLTPPSSVSPPPPPSPSEPKGEIAVELAPDWFIVIANMLGPAPWALQFPIGTVFKKHDLKDTIDVDDLVRREVIRRATEREVEEFNRKFPPLETDAETAHRTAMIRRRLRRELRKAKRFSAKAELCRKWMTELHQSEADFRQLWGNLPPAAPPEEMLKVFVPLNQKAKMAYEPIRLLKLEIMELGEELLVEAQGFADLSPEPLLNFVNSLAMYWPQPNPTHFPADEFLGRFRFKLLHRERRPGFASWIREKWKMLTAISGGVLTVVGGIAALVHYGNQLRQDLPNLVHPTTQAPTQPSAHSQP